MEKLSVLFAAMVGVVADENPTHHFIYNGIVYTSNAPVNQGIRCVFDFTVEYPYEIIRRLPYENYLKFCNRVNSRCRELNFAKRS